MKKYAAPFIVLLSVLFGMSSCKIQAPVFKGVENVKLERAGVAGISFTSEAVIHNPNMVRLKISDMAVDVLLDGKPVATIGKKQDIKVALNSDTRIPMAGSINTQGTLLDNLNSILQMFQSKDVSLKLQGDIKMKAYCFFKYHLPIKFEQKIKLNSIKFN